MIKRVLFAGAVALAATAGTSSQAATFDLGFIMDSSGSVGSTNYLASMDSLAAALGAHIPVGGPDTYTISVVTFGSNARTDITRTVNNAADLAAVVKAVDLAAYTGGGTDFKRAFDQLRGEFATLGDASLVNMMTDGNPNSDAQAVQGRDDLIKAGWDSLSFEAVGGSLDLSFLSKLGFDTGGLGATIIASPAQITDPLNDAFVLKINAFGKDYDAAINAKVGRIVNPSPIPVPAALPMLAAALGVFGFVGRRRRQKTA